MDDKGKIIYSINIEDIQNVAEEEYGRALTSAELNIIENKIGEYFEWYDTIDMLIFDELNLPHRDEDISEE